MKIVLLFFLNLKSDFILTFAFYLFTFAFTSCWHSLPQLLYNYSCKSSRTVLPGRAGVSRRASTATDVPERDATLAAKISRCNCWIKLKLALAPCALWTQSPCSARARWGTA